RRIRAPRERDIMLMNTRWLRSRLLLAIALFGLLALGPAVRGTASASHAVPRDTGGWVNSAWFQRFRAGERDAATISIPPIDIGSQTINSAWYQRFRAGER